MMKVIVLLLKLIGFLPLVNASRTYTAFITNKTYTWEIAKSELHLIGEDTDTPLNDLRVHFNDSFSIDQSSSFSWINALAAYQSWMEYIGCYVINSSTIVRELYVTNGTQLLSCVRECTSSTYVGIKQSKCVCLSDLTIVSNACGTYFCPGEENSLCASDANQCYAIYQRASTHVEQNTGNCLAITITRQETQQVRYEPAPCGIQLYPLCVNSISTFTLATRRSWNGAVQNCFDYSAVLASPRYISSTPAVADGSYWLAQVRKLQLSYSEDFVAGLENYCVAARVGHNGALETILRRCDTDIRALCYLEGGTPDDNPTYPHSTIRTPNTRNRSLKPPISDALLAVLVFIPGLAIVILFALIGWFCLRKIGLKRQTTKNITEPNTDISYCESSSRVTDISKNDNKAHEKEITYATVNPTISFTYYDAFSGKSKTVISAGSKSSLSEEDTYNHLTRSRNSIIKINDYEVVSSDENGDLIEYDTMKSVHTQQDAYLYDSTNSHKKFNILGNYDTVSDTVVTNNEEKPGQHNIKSTNSPYVEITG